MPIVIITVIIIVIIIVIVITVIINSTNNSPSQFLINLAAYLLVIPKRQQDLGKTNPPPQSRTLS